MNNRNKLTASTLKARITRLAILAGLLLTSALAPTALASENVPQPPFGYWADVPPAGQFVLGHGL